VLGRASQAVVLNAEDRLSLAMGSRAGCQRKVLVARAADHAAVVRHCQAGGEAVYLREKGGAPWMVLAKGEQEEMLMPLHDIPATMKGLLKFNESNALFAVALAWVQGVERAVIVQAMSGFSNSAEQNPGRYNFIEGLPFKVLVDYGHNPDGMEGVLKLAASVPVKGRRVMVNVNGLRYQKHLANEVAGIPQGLSQDSFGG